MTPIALNQSSPELENFISRDVDKLIEATLLDSCKRIVSDKTIIVHPFFFCEAQARVRQGSARDGP